MIIFRVLFDFTSGYGSNWYSKFCRETFEDQYLYFKSFLKAYPDKPKFSMIWNNLISHDHTNGMYHVDGYFEKFFIDYEKEVTRSLNM